MENGRFNAIILFATFFLLSYSQLATADDYTFAKNETRGILSEGLSAIREVSTPSERKIIDEIDIDVPTNVHPSFVGAYITSTGEKKIVINVGFSALVRMVGAGYYLGHSAGMADFGDEYAKYCARTFTKSTFDGGLAPWEKINLSESKKKQILQSKSFNATVQGQHMVSLWHVLAHEIAHHLFKHTEKSNKTSDKDKLRFREKMADMWASETLVKLGIPPASAYPAFMYFFYVDPLYVKHEMREDHPADLKRLRGMFNISLAEYDVWNSNTKYFSEIPPKTGIPAFRKLLYHFEEILYEQTDFSSVENNDDFQKCFKYKYQRCIQSCTNKYGNSLDDCRSKYCSNHRSQVSWKLGCNEIVLSDAEKKQFKEFLHEHIRNIPKD